MHPFFRVSPAPDVQHRQIGDLRNDTSGVVAIWFAILLVPMLGIVFGAIKFTEAARLRGDLVDALDSAALAIARRADSLGLDPCDLAADTNGVIPLASENGQMQEYGREVFARNFADSDQLYADGSLTRRFSPISDLNFVITCATVTPEASAYLDMGPILSQFFSIERTRIGTSTEVSLPGSGRVELALVLDVTGSMSECATVSGGSCTGSTTRIEVLKAAVAQMMTSLYGEAEDAQNPFVRVGIVPFSSTVNINPDYFFRTPDGALRPTASWMDLAGEAPWHGSNFLHVEYDNSTGTANAGTWFDIDLDRKVNHFDLYNSINVTHAEWKGCVEERPFPLDETDDAPGSIFTEIDYNTARQRPDFDLPDTVVSATRTRIDQAWNEIPTKSDKYDFAALADPAATRWVPWFNPDEPDCGTSACGNYSSQSGWQQDFHVAGSGDAAKYPAWMLDGPKSAAGHSESAYKNRLFVPDFTYTNVRSGVRAHAEVYRNFIMQYRNTYANNFFVDGDSLSGTLTECGQSKFSFGFDPANAGGMIAAIDKFKAYNCTEREYRLRQAYVGIWNDATQTYDGKYDRADGYYDTNDATTGREIALQGPNYQCSTPLLPLTDQKAMVLDQMNRLIPGGSTNTAIGAIWGWRTLSPGAPFVEASDPETTDGQRWRKFMVLMTDGQNNMAATATHNMSEYSPYGYADENRLNLLTAADTDPNLVDNKYEREFDNKTIRICHRARADGIKVFAIGFAISANSIPEKMLKACAVEPDAYFRAENAAALHEAFGQITDQIVELHISG